MGSQKIPRRHPFLVTPPASGENALHDLAVHIGQAVFAALESIGQLRVIDAHEMHDRRLQVVDVNRILHGIITEFIRGAIGGPAFDAATSSCTTSGKPPTLAATTGRPNPMASKALMPKVS